MINQQLEAGGNGLEAFVVRTELEREVGEQTAIRGEKPPTTEVYGPISFLQFL